MGEERGGALQMLTPGEEDSLRQLKRDCVLLCEALTSCLFNVLSLMFWCFCFVLRFISLGHFLLKRA